ncbi:hypothetical protein [Sorangium sp. So ce341]|uniref:hypothetical protein n=1 Tax=Sorangium sp. So ce341 TaxID=3133302 RepID=UPI003F636EF4
MPRRQCVSAIRCGAPRAALLLLLRLDSRGARSAGTPPPRADVARRALFGLLLGSAQSGLAAGAGALPSLSHRTASLCPGSARRQDGLYRTRTKTLPREVRAFLEAHASPSPRGEGEDEASPSAAESHAWSAGGELSLEQRLRRWATEAVSRSEAERAALAPEIDAAVRATEDGVLCETLASLPDAALRAIWSARARADAWRRTIDISDPALFAYLPSEHYLHADAVLQLILRLGGASALCDFARMLVSLQRELAV